MSWFRRIHNSTRTCAKRKQSQRYHVHFEQLEDRITPSHGAVFPSLSDHYAVGTDAGVSPIVHIYDSRTGDRRLDFFAYHPTFTGGVRVATGDVNNDGVADVITVPGRTGGPHIKVFDGETGAEIRNFMAYAPNVTTGLFVASGDVNGDGFADVITGVDSGAGPHVRAFSGSDGSILRDFFAYHPTFTGGVRVAAADVNKDGFADIITVAGPTGGPHIKVYDGETGAEIRNFMAYAPNVTTGLFVSAGDLNNDGYADIVTGVDSGAGPHVRAFSGADGSMLHDFFAYHPTFTGGVRVAAGDVNGDGYAEIFTVAGPTGGAHVRIYSGIDHNVLREFFAHPFSVNVGLWISVGAGNSEIDSAQPTPPAAPQPPDIEPFNPEFNVVTPDLFAEGDLFTFSVQNGLIDKPVTVSIIGENNQVEYTFPIQVRTDSTGSFTAELQMPYVLGDNAEAGVREIQIMHANVSQRFAVVVHPGTRINVSANNVQENDTFPVEVRNGNPLGFIGLEWWQNNQPIDGANDAGQTDAQGNADLEITVPNLIQNNLESDGFALRVTHNGVTEFFLFIVHDTPEIQPAYTVSLERDRFREGDHLPVRIDDGTGHSRVIVQIWKDGTLKHEFGYRETNASGNFHPSESDLIIPHYLITNAADEDGFVVRVVHADITTEYKVAILRGLTITVPTNNVREGHTFFVAVEHGTGSSEIVVKLIGNGDVVEKQWDLSNNSNMETDGSGFARIGLVMPPTLTGGHQVDGRTIEVQHRGVTERFSITVHKGETNSDGDADRIDTSAPTPKTANATIINLTVPQKVEQAGLVETTNWRVVKDTGVHEPGEEETEPRTLKERTSKSLVVLAYGADQIPYSLNNEGFDRVALELVGNIGNRPLRFRSGDKTSLPRPDSAYDTMLSNVLATIDQLEIESVILAGFSWGGGQINRLASDLVGRVEILGTVFVDAIDPYSLTTAAAVKSLPVATRSHLNIYQSQSSLIPDLHGQSVPTRNLDPVPADELIPYHGPNLGRARQIDRETEGVHYISHGDMDNDNENEERVIAYILDLLEERYPD